MGEEETSFTQNFCNCEYPRKFVQKNWPEVVYALKEHGISCELDMVKCSMTVSTTGKTKDDTIMRKARDIIGLLARAFPASKIVKLLNPKTEFEDIIIGNQEGGICSKYGIDKEQFRERHGWLDNKSTKAALSKLTGTFLDVLPRSVLVIGLSDGLKEMRRIVEDCIRNGVHPESHICNLRRKRKREKNKEHAKIRIRSVVEEFMKTQTQLICCEDKYTTFVEALNQENYRCVVKMIQDTDALEKIADKFSSSDSVEVHANVELILLLMIKCATPELFTELSSTSFIGRLFQHAVEDTRPKHVLFSLLSLFISLLDRARSLRNVHRPGSLLELTSQKPNARSDLRNQSHPRKCQDTARSKTVAAMLEILGDLLKLLDVSSVDNVLLTTYGKLQPPLGSHRLKIVQFIAKLLAVGGKAVEKELISLGGLQKILDLFFKYPYNNLVHGHIERIIVSCLESKRAPIVRHLLHECDLIGKILHSEKSFTLEADLNKPTVPKEGRCPPRIGNIGHLTRISNKIIQLGNNNSEIQAYLQENRDWIEHTTALSKRNKVENVNLWTCGRPTISKDNTNTKDIVITENDYEHVMVSLNAMEKERAFEKKKNTSDIMNETQPDSDHTLQSQGHQG